MSKNFWSELGNDTIHRYPLLHRGRLKKLFCISREIFKKLCLAAQEHLVKELPLKKILAQAPRIKSLPKTPASALYGREENKHSWYYSPTKMWVTRYSELWQWQRVSEWDREYGQDAIINEKRHIIL